MFLSRISIERRNTAVQIAVKDSTPCMAWRFVNAGLAHPYIVTVKPNCFRFVVGNPCLSSSSLPSLFLYGLFLLCLWCFSIFINFYFQVPFDSKEFLYVTEYLFKNALTELLYETYGSME